MLVMLAVSAFTGTYRMTDSITGHQWLVFLIIVLTTGGLATFLYYFGLKQITASLSSVCELAFPLTAVILEFLLHGRLLGWVQWVGVLILLMSILKVSRLGHRPVNIR
jgi:drug/metabolite transporter (DMT)-like permease